MRPLFFFALTLVACASTKTDSVAPPPETPKASSGSPAEAYFPLEQGKQYTYLWREGANNGMLAFVVERTDGTHGKLVPKGHGTTWRYVYEKDGISKDGGAYILKSPVETGTSWPGEHGGTAKIVRTDATAKVGDKTVASCIQVVEDGTRPPARYTTTYCPGIGMVLLEAVGNEADARIELKSYGDPIKMEQGTTVKIEKAQ